MTNAQNGTAREDLFRRVAGSFVDETRANALIDAYRLDVLAEAVDAARGEYLHDQTGTPEDEAYNRAVSDVVAAIALLAEEKK
ncbi:hypothetical protein [Streptomyces hebeiensis]